MHISTQNPTVTTTLSAFGDLVVFAVETGPETVHVAMSPHQALAASAALVRTAAELIRIGGRDAEIVSFAAERRKRA